MSVDKLSILSQADWQRLYPRGNYNRNVNGNTHGITHYFHYFCALTKTDQTIIDQIKTKNLKALTKRDKKVYGLTPLAIACMQGRAAVVNEMLDRMDEACKNNECKREDVERWINKKDDFGWTPLHHAVLTSQEIFDRLREMGADINARTNLGGTCDDLRRLTSLADNPLAKRNVKIEDNKGRLFDLSEISAERLKELTGLEGYRDDPYFSPEHLKKLWMDTPNMAEPVQRFIREITTEYNRLKANPPCLIIGKCAELAQVGIDTYELRADEVIRKGSVIGEYGSSSEKPLPRDRRTFAAFMRAESDPYEFGDITARQYGNVMRFANCGFLNALVIDVVINGAKRNVFIALEDIQPGPIVWNYGLISETGWTRHFPLRQQEMDHFYKEWPTFLANRQDIQQRLDSPGATYFDFLNYGGTFENTIFSISNSTIMLYLHFAGLFNIEKSKKIMQTVEYMQRYSLFVYLNFAVAQTVSDMESAIEGVYTPTTRKKIRKKLLEQFGVLPLDAIIKLMTTIKDHAPQPISEDGLSSMVDSLKDYDATKDPQFPLTVQYVTDATTLYHKSYQEDNNQSSRTKLAGYYHTRYVLITDNDTDTEFYQVLLNLIENEERLHPEGIQWARQAVERNIGRPLSF